MKVSGKMSTFGGPTDTGVSANEGLALISDHDLREWWFRRLFLDAQPPYTTGLARRLDPDAFYIAMRWAQLGIGRSAARRSIFRLSNPANNKRIFAQGADYGPAAWTNRECDMSEGCAFALDLNTDDTVEVEMVE